MNEHHVRVTRTARFFTLGDIHNSLQQVWFLCHGYGQLARYFIQHFEILNDGRRLIVAPEGLSRFYLQGFSDRVGASWMTREDRLHEIDDYVNFLNAVYGQIFEKIRSEKVKVFALGFSQGTATVCRWISHGTAKIDHLILWAGLMPPDLDLKVHHKIFQKLNLTSVVGSHDEFANFEQLADQEKRLREHGISYRLVSFDGGHELNQKTLEELAKK
jgi:predicted esterase